MSKKAGRKDPCPCGSGHKYKKCHIDRPPVDPKSPEFQTKVWALFDSKIAAEKKRKEQFGGSSTDHSYRSVGQKACRGWQADLS
jgi:uncharacterized protein YecA (UPF0149 family)